MTSPINSASKQYSGNQCSPIQKEPQFPNGRVFAYNTQDEWVQIYRKLELT